MKSRLSKCMQWIVLATSLTLLAVPVATAQEVNKGEIPAGHLAKTCKQLPWEVRVWDNEEAMTALQDDTNVLWIDTRPDSFFQKGTVRGAVILTYNISGGEGNDLSADKLQEAITKSGIPKDKVKIAFFCQGPECHRSYNATFVTVKQWGLSPDSVVWYRDGYPNLFQEIKGSAAHKRKAKQYLSDEALSQL
jgi:hypothetical protein